MWWPGAERAPLPLECPTSFLPQRLLAAGTGHGLHAERDMQDVLGIALRPGAPASEQEGSSSLTLKCEHTG